MIEMPPPPELIERLREQRALRGVPDGELAWLVARGRLRRLEAGEVFVRPGDDLIAGNMGLEVVLSGRIAVHQGPDGHKRVTAWEGGDLTGVLPFSRMKTARSTVLAETSVEMFSLEPRYLPDLVRECPELTAVCVHTMIDRARLFKASDLQDEKMASLGKLSAGLAHELNNPAAAIARSAGRLEASMAEADRATRVLAAAGLASHQLEAVDRVRDACMRQAPTVSMSPLERADREDTIAEWLESHGADASAVDALAETAVTVEALDELADHLEGHALDAALDWVAAGCAVRTMARESERAGSKISELVGAMKRLTHMDRAPVPEPVHLERGLRDTIMVLGHKARDKSLSVRIEVAPALPSVKAVGGELEQVWMNVLDNAFDAVDLGGQVSVTAKPEGHSVVVRIVDDGPGIAPEHRDRIFEPFFTTKGPGEGTGLGLDIARAHLRRHGGDIAFDSRPGRTEFRVTLPLAESPASAAGSADAR